MSHRTMRDFLAVLEKKRLLRRIAAPVDRTWEPATLAKWMYQGLPAEKRFGMFFEKVAGSDIPLITAVLGANSTAYATALDTEVDAINETLVAACRNPMAPVVVSNALCQEVVISGSDIRLSCLPIPTWTPGKDTGPYLTTIVVTKDHDTDIQNQGVYRTMVRDEASVVCNLAPARHGGMNALSWTRKGKAAPVAWVIAAPPAVHLASVANLPYGVDEIRLAGGMMGAGVNMVKCKTIDLLVPADAEIIIEGEIYPGETQLEGPFGEFAGYMGLVKERPVVHITAITHRKNPIYYGYTSQMPPSESTTVQSLTGAGVLLKSLRYDLGESTVSDATIDLNFGSMLGHAIIAMRPGYPGHAKKVGRLVAAMSHIKRITLVDDDVDIRDREHVDWAMNARYNPVRDTVLIDDVFFPGSMDSSIRNDTGDVSLGSKIICDATGKIDPGTFSLPPMAIMMKGLERWKEFNLPGFEISKCAMSRIDRP